MPSDLVLDTSEKGTLRVKPVTGAGTVKGVTDLTAVAQNNNIVQVGAPVGPAADGSYDIPLVSGVAGDTSITVSGVNEVGTAIQHVFTYSTIPVVVDPATDFSGVLVNVGPK